MNSIPNCMYLRLLQKRCLFDRIFTKNKTVQVLKSAWPIIFTVSLKIRAKCTNKRKVVNKPKDLLTTTLACAAQNVSLGRCVGQNVSREENNKARRPQSFLCSYFRRYLSIYLFFALSVYFSINSLFAFV